MKTKILFVLLLLFSSNLTFADCMNSGSTSYYVGNDNGTFNIASHFNSAYACPNVEFATCVTEGLLTVNFDQAVDQTTYTAIRSNIATGVIDYALWGEILMNDSHWFWDGISINVYLQDTYQTLGGILQGGNTTESSSGHYYFAFFFPKQTTFNYDVLCGSTVYQKTNMFSFADPGSNFQQQEKEFIFSTGNEFDFWDNVIFSPQGNSDVNITYKAKVHWTQHPNANIRIKKTWIRPLRNIYPPDWVGSPVGLNSLSNDIYISPNNIVAPVYPIVYELFGNGVYQQGLDWMFSPTLAGGGNHVLSYRTNNQGCFSNWIDTIFQVATVVNNEEGPEIDYNDVFDVPYSPLLYGPNYLKIIKTSMATYDEEGNPVPAPNEFPLFHYVCSNSEYNLKIKNPDPNLIYEWLVLYEDQEYATGTGVDFLLTTPDRENVDIETYWGSSHLDDYVTGEDYGYFIFYEGRASNYLGDAMKVYVRSKNVLDNYSNWKDHYLGVVRRPENNVDDLLFCHDAEVPVIFDSLSSTPIYLSVFEMDDIRTLRLNFDSNFSWDYTGDSTSYLPTLPDKSHTILVQTFDSTKIYGRTLDFEDFTWGIGYSAHSEVCYSDIDTLTIIKKPEFDVSFSQVGELSYGTPVQGIISGIYYEDSISNYAWQWSDGSGVYNDDTLWHFLNDLGSYSLTVSVIDEFGCSSTNSYDSVWFVPGYLDLEIVDVASLKIYPNPSTGVVYFEGIENLKSVSIIDLNGRELILSDEFKDGVLDLTSFAKGTYWIKFINEDNVVYQHKIVKL